MKNKFLLFGVMALFAACGHSPEAQSEKREMFAAGGQKVITSFTDEKHGTMSILYGNAIALRNVLNNTGKAPGEAFTLVTWQQIPNPRWYGTNINGNVKSVETVSILASVHGDIPVVYNLVKGSLPEAYKDHKISSRERADFILSQRPSVFP